MRAGQKRRRLLAHLAGSQGWIKNDRHDGVTGFLRVPASAAAGSEDGKYGPEQPVTDRCGELGGRGYLHDHIYAARATLLAISISTLVLAALFVERRRQEAALKLSNERLQLALDAVEQSEARLLDALAAGQVIAFEWNALTRQSRRSENAAAILGPEPVARCNDFFSQVHADDRDVFRAQIRQLRPERPNYAICFRFCCRDGREVWLEEEARGEFDAQGKLLRVKGLTRDISERKRAELAIAERTLQLTLAGKAALVGSFAYATDSERMQISDGYAVIHGYPDGTSEIARSEWRAGVHPEDVARLEELRAHTFRERRNEYGVDYRIVRAGELRWIDARCFVSYRSDGRPHRVVGLTAGTSTLPATVDAVERRLRAFAAR